MLSYQGVKNLAGITLVGDYTSMRALHRVVHDVNERSPIIPDGHRDGAFLALAYDVRKAYEGHREIIDPPEEYPEMGLRYGVKIVWPALLFQHRVLRTSLAYIDHGPEHQALTYALEAVLSDAIAESFSGHSAEIANRWREVDPALSGTFDKFHSRCALFCSWTRGDRLRRLGRLLQSFHPHYDEASFRLARKPDFISPAEFVQWEKADWPDPRW